ncbi:putative cytochrome P450 monooxygenase [Stachybotrys elegans]|uniref:Cytochrome P450 monooxygenase n=1 Tax=Stachybotrys elegans TaxID=80388 RepID=A0A8K0SZN2_9HYPO|nr:putative cytochrome P450 monooxygenase [Stachybotrys elegans]
MTATASALGFLGLLLVFWHIILKPVYNIWFHGLRKYPGPLLWRMSPIPRAWYHARGSLVYKVTELHEKHGDIVRISPTQLAFRQAEAWKDIYGHRAAGEEENYKAADFYRPSPRIPASIVNSSRTEHSIIRRHLAHGFSDRSMRAQEGIIGSYVDLLVQRLHENASSGPLNMHDWYNWTTFDIIGNLGFGSDFDGLRKNTHSVWPKLIIDANRLDIIATALSSIGCGFLGAKLYEFTSSGARDAQMLSREKMKQRIELGKNQDRPDLIHGLIQANLPLETLEANAHLLLQAGSETTSTLLCGATWYLGKHPEALKKLTQEVRSTFKNKEEITLLSVANLHFMLACLNESFRLYPPVAIGLPRRVPKGGATIAGESIPEGTDTAVWHWAINRSPRYWTNPEEFIPERWMGKDEIFANDRLDAMQVFSTGPRNCIGRNLAYAEMRLILARILFDFDLSLAEDSQDWTKDMKCYLLWKKPDLNVYLVPVKHSGQI